MAYCRHAATAVVLAAAINAADPSDLKRYSRLLGMAVRESAALARLSAKLRLAPQGAAEIEAALKELGAAAANRIARSSLTRSATPIVKRAKELVPVDTGALRSIGSSGIIPAPPKNRLGLRPRPQGVKW